MFTKQIGNVIVDFKPLIVFGVIIAIIMLVHLIRAIILEWKFRNAAKKLSLGDYDNIIEIGEKLLNSYQKYNSRLSTKSVLAKIEYLHFSLAVSYFAKSNDEQFLSHVNALNTYSDIKEFWLSLFYLNKNDLDTATTHYNRISCNDNTYAQRTFIESLQAYKNNKIETAQTKMSAIIEQLKHPILKQIADNILADNIL